MENLKMLLANGDLEVKGNSWTSDWENQYLKDQKQKINKKINKKLKTIEYLFSLMIPCKSNEVQQQQQPPVSMILALVKL